MSKIVHIMLAGPVTDGWTYQDNLLTKYHRRLGYEVTMITSQWVWGENGKLAKLEKTDYLNENDVKVIRLPIKGKDEFSKKFKRYRGLYTAIKVEKPDILFIHGVSFCDVKTVVKYIRAHSDIKVFVDNHSDFSNSGTNWLSRNVLHKIIWKHNAQMLLPHTKKFYGVLPARVDWLVDMYGLPKEKCELLVMGGDDGEVEKAKDKIAISKLRKEYNINQHDFLIVTGGKIDSAKKQTLLLMKAVQGIQNENVRLIVFGSVEETLKREVESLSDGNKIQYIGWIKGSDSYQYFAAADLVVFPGRHSVFWEQVAAQGIPMICKYWEGTTHVDSGGNVVFFKEDSVESIAASIRTVIAHTTYEKMKQEAKKNAERFCYSEIARQSLRMEKINDQNTEY